MTAGWVGRPDPAKANHHQRDGQPAGAMAKGKKRFVGMAAGLLAFLLGSAAIADPVRNWTLWKASGSPPVTCQEPAWLEPATLINSRAASNIGRDDGVDYFPSNTVDGEMSTAWVALTTNQPLWISWDLEVPEDVVLICLTPGYAKSPDRFRNQQQLKDIRVSLNGVEHSFSLPRFAETEYQTFWTGRVYCPDCKKVEVEIVSTFPAARGDPEVAISEVVAYRDPRLALLRRLLPER